MTVTKLPRSGTVLHIGGRYYFGNARAVIDRFLNGDVLWHEESTFNRRRRCPRWYFQKYAAEMGDNYGAKP